MPWLADAHVCDLAGCCLLPHALQQKRKECKSCGVIVGPGYFFFKGVTNRTPPANRYQHGEEQADLAAVLQQAAADSSQQDEEGGGARRELLHVFIFSESAVVMGAAFQRVFFHVRHTAFGGHRGGTPGFGS